MFNTYGLSTATVVAQTALRTLPVLSKISVSSGSKFWPTHLQTVGFPVPNGNLGDFTLFYADINVVPFVRWMPLVR
jgi:hypothetical protein